MSNPSTTLQASAHTYERDEQVFSLIKDERERQERGIELIASENFASPQVMEAAGSVLNQ